MKLTPLLGSFIFTGIIGSSVLAGDLKDEAADNKIQAPVPQTHCPVMGGKIDSSFYTDIQGQRIYHCCDGCSNKLTADPDTYFKKAGAEGVLFENIQTKCPVNGKTIDKSIYLDYEGRRVYFASSNCIDKFAKDPVKYLAKLDEKTQHKDMKQHQKNNDAHQKGHGGHRGGCGGM